MEKSKFINDFTINLRAAGWGNFLTNRDYDFEDTFIISASKVAALAKWNLFVKYIENLNLEKFEIEKESFNELSEEHHNIKYGKFFIYAIICNNHEESIVGSLPQNIGLSYQATKAGGGIFFVVNLKSKQVHVNMPSLTKPFVKKQPKKFKEIVERYIQRID